jgi:hypothetical protein
MPCADLVLNPAVLCFTPMRQLGTVDRSGFGLGRRGDRGSDRTVPARPRPVSRRAGPVGRGVRSRRTVLHNFASYAAALAGYTAAIIAADELGATGGPNANAVFLLAVYRASEICIG